MTDLVKDLEGLESAEEFFAYFGLDYDPRVLAAARLHILKRFRDHLGGISELEEINAHQLYEVCYTALKHAYDQFADGQALAVGAFPRLEQIRRAFVPLAAVSVRLSQNEADLKS